MLELLSLLILGAAAASDAVSTEEPSERELGEGVRRAVDVWRSAGVPILGWGPLQETEYLLFGHLSCPEGHLFPHLDYVEIPDSGRLLIRGTVSDLFDVPPVGICLHPEHVGSRHFAIPESVLAALGALSRDPDLPRMLFLVFTNPTPGTKRAKELRELIVGDGKGTRREFPWWMVKEIVQSPSPDDLLRVVKMHNEGDPDAFDPHALRKIRKWAEQARPGDVIDGYYNIEWIIAVRPDALNHDGDHAQFTYDWPPPS